MSSSAWMKIACGQEMSGEGPVLCDGGRIPGTDCPPCNEERGQGIAIARVTREYNRLSQGTNLTVEGPVCARHLRAIDSVVHDPGSLLIEYYIDSIMSLGRVTEIVEHVGEEGCYEG